MNQPNQDRELYSASEAIWMSSCKFRGRPFQLRWCCCCSGFQKEGAPEKGRWKEFPGRWKEGGDSSSTPSACRSSQPREFHLCRTRNISTAESRRQFNPGSAWLIKGPASSPCHDEHAAPGLLIACKDSPSCSSPTPRAFCRRIAQDCQNAVRNASKVWMTKCRPPSIGNDGT